MNKKYLLKLKLDKKISIKCTIIDQEKFKNGQTNNQLHSIKDTIINTTTITSTTVTTNSNTTKVAPVKKNKNNQVQKYKITNDSDSWKKSRQFLDLGDAFDYFSD